jgi:hypothetical protein
MLNVSESATRHARKWRSKENGRAVAGPPVLNFDLFSDLVLLHRFVGGVEGVLQGHEVFAGFEGVERDLFGF